MLCGCAAVTISILIYLWISVLIVQSLQNNRGDPYTFFRFFSMKFFFNFWICLTQASSKICSITLTRPNLKIPEFLYKYTVLIFLIMIWFNISQYVWQFSSSKSNITFMNIFTINVKERTLWTIKERYLSITFWQVSTASIVTLEAWQ